MRRARKKHPVLVLCSALCAAAGLSLATGCSSFTTYKHATPLGAGKSKVSVAPQMSTVAGEHGATLPYPELAFAMRRGITDRLDVGGSVAMLPLGDAFSSIAFEGSVQHQVYRSPSGRYELALGAGAGYRATATTGAVFETVHASVPLILGVNLGRHQLVLSPYGSWQRWYSEGTSPVDVPALGTSVGFYWQITRRVALHPELAMAWTPVVINNRGDTRLGHLGIAVVFGRRHQNDRR